MAKVFVLGSLNYDLVIRSPYIPKKGETVRGSGFITNCGGKGANQAVAAALAGCETHMAGCVGGDAFGAEMLSGLKAYGVHDGLVRKAGVNSGVAVIVVSENDNRIILDAGANALVSAADADAVIARAGRGDYLITQFEIPMNTIAYALKRAKEAGIVTIVNPAPAPAKNAVLPDEILLNADYFIPNETEAMEITGKSSPDEAAAELLRRGAKNVIITLGSKGAAGYSAGDKVFVPAYKVSAVDTTAAGDTFIGYLTSGLMRGLDLAGAMRLGCAASSLSVQKAGAQCSIPTADEVTRVIG